MFATNPVSFFLYRLRCGAVYYDNMVIRVLPGVFWLFMATTVQHENWRKFTQFMTFLHSDDLYQHTLTIPPTQLSPDGRKVLICTVKVLWDYSHKKYLSFLSILNEKKVGLKLPRPVTILESLSARVSWTVMSSIQYLGKVSILTTFCVTFSISLLVFKP